MVLFYILLIAYILSINFYAFLLIKSAREKEMEQETNKQSAVLEKVDGGEPTQQPTSTPVEKNTGKLCITGLLGGAITLYTCMFLYKYKRSDLLLMVLMPLLGVLNIYLWVLLFRSGFSFLMIR